MQAIEPLAYRSVINRRTNLHPRSADELRIQLILRLDFLSGYAFERLRQPRFFRRREFVRRRDHGVDNSQPPVHFRIERLLNLAEKRCAVVIHQNEYEIPHFLAQGHFPGNFAQNGFLRLCAHRWIREQIAQIGGLGENLREIGQILADFLRIFVLEGHIGQSRAIPLCERAHLAASSSSATKPLNNSDSLTVLIRSRNIALARSIASRVAITRNSVCAARSAARISPCAESRMRFDSSCASARMRSPSAALSRFARSRMAATSESSEAIFRCASACCRSASSRARALSAIAPAISFCRLRKNGGAFFAKNHTSTATKIEKLIQR